MAPPTQLIHMALVRSLFARFARRQQRRKEAPDIWKLYHYLYFYKQAVEKASSFEPEVTNELLLKQPRNGLSVEEQYEDVHSAVTEQVAACPGGQSRVEKGAILISSPTHLSQVNVLAWS